MDEPREVNIDMFQCPEELIESLEDLQYKVEELQACCQEQETRNQELQQFLIDNERDFKCKIRSLNEEVSKLRDIKVRLVRENVMKECAVAPRWFNALTKTVEQEKKIDELSNKVDELNLQILEKTKVICSLEWKLRDSDATITVLTSDRNRLAMEVEDMALRIEEFEYAENFRKKDPEKIRSVVASFDSCEEEVMSYSDKRNGLHSRTSNQSEEESENFVPLQRAANFSNINTLDETADFRTELTNLPSDLENSIPKPNVTMNSMTDQERNNNFIDQSNVKLEARSVEVMMANGKDIVDKSKKDHVNSLVQHRDLSWEKFDRSSSALDKPVDKSEEKVDVTVDREKSNVFEEQDLPFLKMLESTPSSKNGRFNEIADGKSLLTTEESSAVEDPWISPALSPIIEKKSNNSRNLFWEKNSDCTIYPFYLPEGSEDEDEEEEDRKDINKNGELTPRKEEEIFRHLEPFKDKVDHVSGTSLPSNFTFDEKMMSFDEGNPKPTNVVVKRASKENLWDFEPDSIVDVSTGQTIYESLQAHEESQMTEKEPHEKIDAGSSSPTSRSLVLDDKVAASPLMQDHARSRSDSCTEASREKDRKLDSKRTKSNVESRHQETEFIKKGSKKERAALQAYIQWKVQGKQGVPPANFKISLC